MKTILLSTMLLCTALLPFTDCSAEPKQLSEKAPHELQDVRIIGKTNKSPLSYLPGEEMVFTFTLDTGNDKPGDWRFFYVRKGDDNQTFQGYAPIDKPLIVKTSIKKAGFVSVNVYIRDKHGRNVSAEFTRPNKTKFRRNIAFLAGTAVHPESLEDCGEPADFDKFWERQLKRLEDLPFEGKVQRKMIKETANGYIYALSIPAPGPRPATGYMTIPKNAKAKSLSISVTFYGYGAVKQGIPGSHINQSSIRLFINAHGQELGREPEYYKQFFQSIRSGKYNYAQDPEQNKNPETCFFNGMVLRNLRAMQYAKTLPEWNGKDLIVSGGSQGGLQTMWAAALDQDVTEANPSITWCCDLAGTEKKQRLCGSWRVQYVPGLDYYDPVFMAKRIKKAKVVIIRAGLGDYTCPPSGLAICYKNLATPNKTIKWYQGSDHGFVPKDPEIIIWTTNK